MWTCRMRAVVGDEHRRGGAAGRRPRWCLLPQGGLSSGDAPPISLLSCQKRNGPCTVQREKRWRAPVQWPSARRGSAYRCLLRFCLTFGHARLFYEVDTAVPWRMVPTASGWLSHGPASIFAAAGCSSKKRERQRGESLRVSLTAPGWRFPQGRRVSVPDCRKGVPAFPRRRQEVCACADRPAKAFFSFGPCTARFLFGKIEKKMGGALPSHQHG